MPRPAPFWVIAVATLSLTSVFTAPAEAVTSQASRDRINSEIISFGEQNPDDFVGLDALAFRRTGKHIVVAVAGAPRAMTAAEAQSSMAQPRRADITRQAGIPNFNPTIVATPLTGPPAQYRVTGRWNFPDTWAGQSSPVDLAALTFQMPSCMRMINYSISTYSYQSVDTHAGSLRTTSGFTGGLWNVADKQTGPSSGNTADHGGAGITVQDGCSGSAQVGAAFDYEANQGSSIASVSVSFGIFSVSYNSQNLTKHLGTPPVYFNL